MKLTITVESFNTHISELICNNNNNNNMFSTVDYRPVGIQIFRISTRYLVYYSAEIIRASSDRTPARSSVNT